MEHLKLAECGIFLDRGQPEIDREDHAVGSAGLDSQDAIVARLQSDDRRIGCEAAGCDLVHRADIDGDSDFGLAELAPVGRVKALPPNHAKAVQIKGMREIDDESSL